MNDSIKSIVVLLGVAVLGMLMLQMLVPSAEAFSQNPTHSSPQDPQEPDCPQSFSDAPGGAHGDGWDENYVQVAFGNALLDCDGKYAQARNKQSDEYYDAKTKCEEVEGCKFGYKVLENVICHGDVSQCEPIGSSTGPFTCTADGAYDLGDYTCEPIKEIPPETKGQT